MQSKTALSGIPVAELETLLSPLPAYRARQVFAWINRGVCSFDAMTNLPLALRHELDSRFCLRKTAVVDKFEDASGEAAKLRIGVEGGIIEAMVLQDAVGRRTACLSTQLGCPMGCVFCKTGSMGLARNLDSAEIAEQLYHIRALYPDISNIVIMGMGEPLLNLNELRRALAALCETASPRRITISTCGLADGIKSLADDGPAVRLAVSLTTAREELRRCLMPSAASTPLAALKQAIMYHQKRRGQRVTLEAVLLGGLNTGNEDAAAMAVFARGLDVVVNLIPWNPVAGLLLEGTPLKEPSASEAVRFRARLEAHGLKTVLRRERGRSIAGACGQLGSKG